MRNKRRGLSLTEVIIALAIAIMVMVPVTSMFSTSGNQVQKSRNFSFAAALARRISQHIMAMPFEDIAEVPLPGQSLHDSADDPYFSPVINFSDNQSGIKRIKAGEMPALYDFLVMNDFKYSLSVSNVSFGAGDEIKSVAIMITWKEAGRDMIYRTHVYVSSV
ncbi:MAG: type II secretion system protein [Candidatus Riflebacteria bacterium]|nr:type II secretion system protein [Candidatus Riflebacteria bacterium]